LQRGPRKSAIQSSGRSTIARVPTGIPAGVE
jgi:hypothetical protein